MPPTCTICRHRKRPEIDEALLASEPFRHIAARFGTSTGALQRHKPHIAAALLKSKQAAEISQADSLVDQLKDLQAKSLDILKKAENAGDLRAALAGIREARATVELLARLTGEMARAGEGPPVEVVIVMPPPIPAGGEPARLPPRRLPPELSAPAGAVIDVEPLELERSV